LDGFAFAILGTIFLGKFFGHSHFDEQFELGELVQPIIGGADQVGISVEPTQQVHGEPVVMPMAFAPDSSGPDDRLDIAVDSALHQSVRYLRQGQQQGGAPGVSERPALGAVAQDIGALHAHARRARSPGHHAAFCQYVEEGANARGRPAVGAGTAAGANIAANSDGRLKESFGEHVRGLFHVEHVRGFILESKWPPRFAKSGRRLIKDFVTGCYPDNTSSK
jgi:hypothetical protein